MKLPALISEIQQIHTTLAKRATSAVNISLTARNWLIGAYLVEFEQHGQDRAQYGKKLIHEIATRLKCAGVKGLGTPNLKRCRQFYSLYPAMGATLSHQFPNLLPDGDSTISATVSHLFDTTSDHSDFTIPHARARDILTQLSFSHLVELLKIDDPLKRTFYEIEAIKGRWSVRDLKRQIGSLLFERTGLSKDKEKLIELTNQGTTDFQPRHLIRDPYIFEFLGLHSQDTMEESDLETALLDHLQAFILELGRGFCFEHRQRKILIGDDHFFIDLVFYHRLLKCHVLIELKLEAFSHANAGQLNTYLNWFKENEMQADDNPPVGLLLCTDRKAPLAKYTLGGMDENLFVSQYQLQLPDPSELEEFLRKELAENQ